jgi:hypothetical protein
MILTPVWLYQCSSLNPTLGPAGAKRRYGKWSRAMRPPTWIRYASSMSASARPVPSLRRRVCGSLIPPDRNML